MIDVLEGRRHFSLALALFLHKIPLGNGFEVLYTTLSEKIDSRVERKLIALDSMGLRKAMIANLALVSSMRRIDRRSRCDG